jgi:hypothetical protein
MTKNSADRRPAKASYTFLGVGAAVVLLAATYGYCYFALSSLGHVGLAGGNPPTYRMYRSPSLAILFTPAAAVESWLTGKPIESRSL